MPETLAGMLIRRFAAHVLTLADALLDDTVQNPHRHAYQALRLDLWVWSSLLKLS